jgi:hypothetical protein
MSVVVRFRRAQLSLGFGIVTSLVATSCSETPTTLGDVPTVEVVPPPAFLSSEFNQYEFLGFVKDDAGANDTPAQSDLNAFTRADNVGGKIGVKWVWDDVNAWTGSGQTGDACALFDTDGNPRLMPRCVSASTIPTAIRT